MVSQGVTCTGILYSGVCACVWCAWACILSRCASAYLMFYLSFRCSIFRNGCRGADPDFWLHVNLCSTVVPVQGSCFTFVAVAIVSRNQTLWSLLFEFFFVCWLIALLFTGENTVSAIPMNVCRHTWPVVCGDRCRSSWLCAHGLWCFATVREQQGYFCIFLSSQ